MSSKGIIEVDVSQNCRECKYFGFDCKITGEKCNYFNEDGRPETCPIKPIIGWIPVEERLLEGKVNGKDDADKPVPHRVPPAIIWAIEKVRAFGCRKYPEDSWREVETQRYWDAAMRHMLTAWEDFRAVDPESGLPHIWHVACNLAFIIAKEWWMK